MVLVEAATGRFPYPPQGEGGGPVGGLGFWELLEYIGVWQRPVYLPGHQREGHLPGTCICSHSLTHLACIYAP